MPVLYNAKTHELFHLSAIWMKKDTSTEPSSLMSDVLTANAAALVADPDNIDLWTDFFTQVSAFADTFSEQNPHAADASHATVMRRTRDLELTEEHFQAYIHGSKEHFYFQAQLFNYLAEGYEYAGLSGKAQEYKLRLINHLPESHIEILCMRIDSLNQHVAELREKYGKPRDSLTPEGVSAFDSATSALQDIYSIFKASRVTLYELHDHQKISLIYAKFARCFRKLDLLDDALHCARMAYQLDDSSNVRLNNLAIILHKQGTSSSLLEAISLLQLQLSSDLNAGHKRFVTPYYLTYALCQQAHYGLSNADTLTTVKAYLERARNSALHAESAIEGYTDSNYALKAKLRLELIKTYQNQLISLVNQLLPLVNKLLPLSLMQQVPENFTEVYSQAKSVISERRQQSSLAKQRFFKDLGKDGQQEAKPLDFTNTTCAILR